MDFPQDTPPPAGLPRLVTRPETLDELDGIVENSSEKNRNFFIAYLGLLIYVQVIVFSTTDLQLLTSTDVKLPIIDVNVPLVGFYIAVPFFVIALHFNFLQNLESHHYKLMRWQDAHPGRVGPRSHLQAFLFDYAMLERGSQLERWVRWANSLLCFNLVPITLGLLLWRYTDRQDALVTLWHFTAFAIDNYLVWKLRQALRQNEMARGGSATGISWGFLDHAITFGRFCRDIFRHDLHGAFGLFIFMGSVNLSGNQVESAH